MQTVPALKSDPPRHDHQDVNEFIKIKNYLFGECKFESRIIQTGPAAETGTGLSLKISLPESRFRDELTRIVPNEDF
jgi:hypothetical protein